MNLRTVLVSLGIVALLGLLVAGLIMKGESGLAVGEPVPTASLPTLPESAETMSLTDLRGDWVLVNVWASWCGPCRAESPALEKFAAENEGKVTVLGVNTQDLSEDALKFMREYDLSYPQIRDASGEYAATLKTSGVPETFLIDPEGNLAGRYAGPFSDLAAVNEFVEPALGQAG